MFGCAVSSVGFDGGVREDDRILQAIEEVINTKKVISFKQLHRELEELLNEEVSTSDFDSYIEEYINNDIVKPCDSCCQSID